MKCVLASMTDVLVLMSEGSFDSLTLELQLANERQFRLLRVPIGGESVRGCAELRASRAGLVQRLEPGVAQVCARLLVPAHRVSSHTHTRMYPNILRLSMFMRHREGQWTASQLLSQVNQPCQFARP